MIAKLKDMEKILYHPTVKEVKKNNHYWKFYYIDKPALGFRDFYLKYWRGDRIVDIKPKKDRKKNVIPGKFEIYGKRGNYVFTAYRCWFEWIKMGSKMGPEWIRNLEVKPNLTSLGWNELFEI